MTTHEIDGAQSGWVQLGDEVLAFGSSPPAMASEQAGGRGRPLRATELGSHRLRLVIQNGRQFQQQHPTVPVLLDKGRYLVVELGAERRESCTRPDESCYTVLPLPRNSVVFESNVRVVAQDRVDWIAEIVAHLRRETFEADLRTLTTLPTRLSTSPEFQKATKWSSERLTTAGYTVRTVPISVHGAPSANVIAERRGSGPEPRDVILVTAHLDSINIPNGPAGRAPGADDNGSGSAGVLAMAEAFRDHRGRHDLRFILFGGEEQDLFGSRQYVDALSARERGRIRAVVNMDMIGTVNTPERTVLLEGAPEFIAIVNGLAEVAATYTTLALQKSFTPANSDHVPFIRSGIPAVLTIEGTDSANKHIHSANDTLSFIDYELALEILKMNVAYVAGLLGRVQGS